MKRLLAFFAIATFGITTLSAENVETVYSPDGKVKLSFSLSEEGRRQKKVVPSIRWIAANCLPC